MTAYTLEMLLIYSERVKRPYSSTRICAYNIYTKNYCLKIAKVCQKKIIFIKNCYDK